MIGDSASASGLHPSETMLRTMQERFLADLGETVDWYYREMPRYYLRVTPAEEQIRHLESVHALRRGGGGRLTMVDDARSAKLLFFGRPATHTLSEVVAMLGERPFHRIELHTSRDRSLFIYAFVYGASPAPAGFDMAKHRQAIIAAACTGADAASSTLANRYLDAVDQGYLARSAVERVERHLRCWSRLASGEDVHVEVEDYDDGVPMSRVLIAARAAEPRRVLAHLARVGHRHDLRLERGYLDLVPAIDDDHRHVLIVSAYLSDTQGRPLSTELARNVTDDLETLRRLPPDDWAARYEDGSFSFDQIELLRAASGFAGQLLTADHPYLAVGELAAESLRSDPALCRELCALVDLRFHPLLAVDSATWTTRHAELLARIRASDPPVRALVLEGMLQFIAAIRLTNLYRRNRLGLACQLDPGVLPEGRFPQRPYGVFSFHGPGGRGYHVRFRASARGGLRLLLPRNLGQWQRARDGLLKEVYDLAWAQQLKNKDIPEGGSKCIALVEVGADPSAVVRQVVDPLLDLILPPGQVPEVIGPHRAPRGTELIFLGPDENMTPERIVWVAERARQRGLPHHLTLMSSKPGSGINHKEYGVTSEGLFRWILQVLPLAGIAEGAPYSVKLTGGPDGDLGGNLVRILRREHRDRCRIVAIADGTGSAFDPIGLAWDELLRLAEGSLGIAAYRPETLRSADGQVVPASDRAGELIRNNLHNVIQADLFVPCGGRPYTINDQNWKAFLRADGRPSAAAMVEGANIFITPTARKKLEDAGLVVIKDSSANKGGVICSSYEVLAGLVLSEEEFLRHKSRYVSETIDLLRARADSEGRALIAAWKRRGHDVRLSELSQQISDEINRISGLLEPVIEAHLDDAAYARAWTRHLHRHCPPVLVEHFAERLITRIPRAHRVAILAKRLSSVMVYREGLTWVRAYLTEDRIWEVLSTWLEAEEKVARAVAAVQRLDLPDGDELTRIISAGSQRELVRERLGQEF